MQCNILASNRFEEGEEEEGNKEPDKETEEEEAKAGRDEERRVE